MARLIYFILFFFFGAALPFLATNNKKLTGKFFNFVVFKK